MVDMRRRSHEDGEHDCDDEDVERGSVEKIDDGLYALELSQEEKRRAKQTVKQYIEDSESEEDDNDGIIPDLNIIK